MARSPSALATANLFAVLQIVSSAMLPKGSQNEQVEEDDWHQEDQQYLDESETQPPSKVKVPDRESISTIVAERRQDAIEQAKRQEKFNTEGLQFLSASLIEMIAQLVVEPKRETVRRSLSKLMLSTGHVSAVHFSEKYKPYRMSIVNVIQNIIISEAGLYRDPFLDQPLTIQQNVSSRYQMDYEELEEIGAGGFGRVFKVKSNLDHQLYAVKKIKIRRMRTDSISLEAVLHEVRILASLNHEGIVRYHVSWFELDDADFPSSVSSSLESQVNIEEMNAADNNEKSSSDEVSWAPSTHSRQRPQSKFYGDSTDESTTSDSDSTGSSSQSEDRNKERDDGDCEIFFKSSSSSDSDDGSQEEDSDTESSQALLPLVPAMPEFKNNFESFTVYIVMGLCRQSLEDYLQKRNNSLRPTVNLMDAYSIFEDILSALSYLHEDGLRIIHRDIKPSNIFLQETPKGIRAILGDFGLACHQERDFSDVVSPSSHCNGDGDHLRTEGVGTIHYAPPEQLSSKHYDCSVDIYSLGLVMYEFFHTAKTAMERVQLLGSIRRTGKVSEQFRSRWGEIGNLIERMVHVDPTQRPSASTILNEMQLTSPKTVKKLKQALRTKDAQIAMLRKRLQDYKDNCTCGFYTTGR